MEGYCVEVSTWAGTLIHADGTLGLFHFISSFLFSLLLLLLLLLHAPLALRVVLPAESVGEIIELDWAS